MGKLSLVFKALSEPLRLRIVHLLLRAEQEPCGEELARALRVPAYRLSRHLKVLKATGLINERKEGRWVYYRLAKRNGQLLGVLRRLIAKAPQTFGNPRRMTTSSKQRSHVVRRRRKRLVKQKEFNWNEGPAIPGIL